MFGLLAVLTVAASPLAFLLLAIFLAGIGLGMLERGRRLIAPAAILLFVGGLPVPAHARVRRRRPLPVLACSSSLCILTFCVLGALLTWRVECARALRWFFVAYGVVSLATYAFTTPLGENIARVRLAALPIAVLVLSLRRWRPLPVAALVLVLAAMWNLGPHAWALSRSAREHEAAERRLLAARGRRTCTST